jgi:hypothetical protein
MINFELFIEGYPADVSADLPALLTFALDDVRDFAARSTTFSKTIVMPGTARNNALLGNIFELNSANTTDDELPNISTNFNAFKGAGILIFQNNIQCLKGTLRLLEIVNDKGRIEYEVAVFGELNSFIGSASAHLLEELDFSAYDHTYDETNISDSWDNAGAGEGYYYPLIDYGTYSVNKHDWDIKTFRPALFVKEYIDKIFEAAGFTYVSTLLGTSRFKSLIIPHNQKQLLTKTSRILYANETTSHQVLNTMLGNTSYSAPFDYVQAGSFTYAVDPFGGSFTYNDPASIATTLQWQLTGTRQASTPGTFYMEIRVNGVSVSTSPTQTIPPGGMSVPYVWTGTASVTLNQNDVVDVHYVYGGTGTNVIVTIAPTSFFIINSLNPTYVPVSYGQTVTVNDAIPKNIRQLDFFSSIIKLFNLYVWEDKFDEHKLYIEPYIDFYDLDASSAIDWSYKLNRNKPVNIKPLSEISSRYYDFNYKSDSDYYNDLYKKRYNQTYGSRIYDSSYQFGSNNNSLELIFSGTPIVGYGGEDKVYSTIFKLNNNVEETIDSNIRILLAKKVTGLTSWDMMDGVTTLSSFTDYGYGGHLDDPDAPTNDLGFGVPAELFFTLVSGSLTANQFNVYWSAYMAEITDKDSKLVTAQFRLKAMDIFNLDFSKLIYLDGSLFRLNKIEDYNATTEDECRAELLRVINLTY